MELSDSTFNKILIFSPKKIFYFLKKAVFIFQEMETMKKFLIFSQKKAFLVFHETEAPPKKIPYISGN